MTGHRADGRLANWLDGIDHSPSDADRESQVTDSPEGGSRVSSGAEHASSLNDILRNDNEPLPEELGLPESHTSSSTVTDHNVDRNGPQNSLEDVLQTGTPAIPSAVHLTAPTPSERNTPQENPRVLPGADEDIDQRQRIRYRYDKTLENASKVLHHIKNGNTRKESRYDRTSIVYYDYIENSRSNPTEIRDARYIASLRFARQDVRQRLLVVEDLCKLTINALGETFNINPEFFEEHLLNSGYAGAEYDMSPARTWATASFKKSYVSMKWIRPVYRMPMYTSNRSMKDLVSASTSKQQGRGGEKEKPPGEGIENFTRRGFVTTRVFTNIFRSEWALWTDPDKTGSMPRECGLEERVSVWKGKLPNGNCEISIILLDPLPEVEETSIGSSGDDSTSAVSSLDIELAEQGLSSNLEEEESLTEEENLQIEQPLLLLWIKKYLDRRPRKPGLTSMSGGDLIHSKVQKEQKIIVNHISPRHEVAVDLDQVFQKQEWTANFEQTLSSTTSTAAGIRSHLQRQSGPISLTDILVQIIRQDTLALLQQINQVLDGVETGILDDNKMEDRLLLWRQVISRAQWELPALKASIEPFIAFIDVPHSSRVDEGTPKLEPEMMHDIRNLSKAITETCARLRQVSSLLTSNMGLLDSRRSIDEAHAVSRLTELAFVFVPLSFATSIFGMQIVPFADPVPVRIFIGVALGVTSFAYLMRMNMRSQWFRYFKVVTRREIQKYAESHGLAVPTRSVPLLLTLQWIGSRVSLGCKQTGKLMSKIAIGTWSLFGFAILFLFLNGLVAGVPIAALWVRGLDPGTQAAVTIATMMIVFTCVGIPMWRMSDPEFRDALPRLIFGWTRLIPSWVWKAIVLNLTAAISLALIWSRPLAAGIKGALTVGILLFMGLILLAVFLRLRS